ncbi:probable palmitoyltransferase ZDHHC12 [Lingula anatina]|uniref:Palmitoyltransferase n=1 Tax=Lingula anatina TaxID=7574 RepID=A0A1S3KDG5_LINAN|nr:probable palmitoyltransferase ZDHHC12 [Lingula anatina]|eukprot:XP_013420301.1 probable palmitoyltransferase ZDHHC12 [Lingula anatina]
MGVCSCLSALCRRIRCGTHVLVRLAHTGLSVGVPATLIFKDSILHKSLILQEDLAYGIGYLLLLMFSLAMYYTACFMDPGYVPVNRKKSLTSTSDLSSDEEEEDDVDSAENSTMLKISKDSEAPVKLRKCGFCNIEQPMRARHCEDCDRCVYKYDHHCPWLETCVGEKNHKYFWLFLFSKAVIIWWTLYIAWKAIVHTEEWNEWFNLNVLFVLDILILIVGGLTVTGLLTFHSYLMLTNMTTWELVSRERITYLRNLDEELNPFHQGYCRNAITFLCNCRLTQWASLYAKKLREELPSGLV